MQRAISFCRMWQVLKTGKLAVLNYHLGWHVRWCYLISSYDLTKYFACVHRFFPVSEAWSCWAKTRKHSEREPGPKKPTSLQSTDLTRLVSFEAKMLVTTSPLVRCTLLFHFLCCQGLSIFSDKQQPQAQTFSWQIHSNKEPSVTIEPWWKDFWKSWSWHYISLWRL